MGDEEQPKAGVSWVQVAGSALAAVSSAVLLSTLGVAGTVIGAAVGSVIATVGTSLYTRTLDVSRQQVAAQAAALRRVTRAHSDLDDAVSAMSRGDATSASRIARAGEQLDRAEQVLAAGSAGHQDGALRTLQPDDVALSDEPGRGVPPGDSSPRGLRQVLADRLSWRRVAVVAGAVFLVTMVAITAFEMATGRAVSTYTGGSDRQTGSTVPGIERDTRPASPAPSDDVTDDGEPVEEPTEAGSDAPAPTESATPTDEPTASPSTTPTPSPSPEVTVPPTPLPSSTATGSTGG